MKFDEVINYIAENTTPVAAEMARPKNPDFEKWKEENPGVPTYKFFKMQRAKKAGALEPAAASSVPVVQPPATDKYKELPDTLRTKEAVANFIQHNPDASYEEVVAAITPQNTEETPLNLDPEVVTAAIAAAAPGSGETVEPSAAELKKADLTAKYDRMRQALYRSRGLTAKPGRKAISREVEPGEEEEDFSGSSRGINMRDEPVDPNEI